VDGLKWRLSMELPLERRDGVRDTSLESESSGMVLVFARGPLKKLVEVPSSFRLGASTHLSLRALLDHAYRVERKLGAQHE
jgi:hypothetical protein